MQTLYQVGVYGVVPSKFSVVRKDGSRVIETDTIEDAVRVVDEISKIESKG